MGFKKVIRFVATVLLTCCMIWQPVWADPSDGEGEDPTTGHKCGGVETSIIDCTSEDEEGGALFDILAIVINILTFGVGIAATVGLVISAYQYMTAGDNPGQIQKAKTRIMEIIIGLAVYALMWGVLNFLLPGGVFGDGS